MTNEKFYERLLELKKSSSQLSPETESSIDNLVSKNANSHNSGIFVLEFASLLVDVKNAIRESQAATTGRKEQYKACESILKNARNDAREKLYNAFMFGGYQNFCDSIRLIRLKNPLDFAMPDIKDPIDTTRLMSYKPREEIELPDLGLLRAYVKTHKIESKEKGVVYSFGNFEVDARYLVSMMEALPGAKAYHDGKPLGQTFFESDEGDGLLCATRPCDGKVRPKTEI